VLRNRRMSQDLVRQVDWLPGAASEKRPLVRLSLWPMAFVQPCWAMAKGNLPD
jgi:hypothetical protein